MKILENYIAPTEHSQGDVGDIWIDKSTGDVYKCTGLTGSAKDLGYIAIGADATNTKYVWEKLGGSCMFVYAKASDNYPYVYLDEDMDMDNIASKQHIIDALMRGNVLLVNTDDQTIHVPYIHEEYECLVFEYYAVGAPDGALNNRCKYTSEYEIGPE